jgi:hypothetical protein
MREVTQMIPLSYLVIQGITESFEVIKELTSLESQHSTGTGEDLFLCMCKYDREGGWGRAHGRECACMKP